MMFMALSGFFMKTEPDHFKTFPNLPKPEARLTVPKHTTKWYECDWA